MTIKQNPNSRPPVSSGVLVRSSVDYARENPIDSDSSAEEDDPLLGEHEQAKEEQENSITGGFLPSLVAETSETGKQVSTYLAGLFNGTVQATEGEDEPDEGTGSSLSIATNAVDYLTSFLTGAVPEAPVESAPVESGPPALSSSNSVIKNFKLPGKNITSPLPHLNAVEPTLEQLKEIYQPKRVQRQVGHRQFLRHVPTGFSVPIPSQQRIMEAIDIGGGDLAAKVTVTHAQEKVVVKKVEKPPLTPKSMDSKK